MRVWWCVAVCRDTSVFVCCVTKRLLPCVSLFCSSWILIQSLHHLILQLLLWCLGKMSERCRESLVWDGPFRRSVTLRNGFDPRCVTMVPWSRYFTTKRVFSLYVFHSMSYATTRRALGVAKRRRMRGRYVMLLPVQCETTVVAVAAFHCICVIQKPNHQWDISSFEEEGIEFLIRRALCNKRALQESCRSWIPMRIAVSSYRHALTFNKI